MMKKKKLSKYKWSIASFLFDHEKDIMKDDKHYIFFVFYRHNQMQNYGGYSDTFPLCLADDKIHVCFFFSSLFLSLCQHLTRSYEREEEEKRTTEWRKSTMIASNRTKQLIMELTFLLLREFIVWRKSERTLARLEKLLFVDIEGYWQEMVQFRNGSESRVYQFSLFEKFVLSSSIMPSRS